MAKHTFSKAWSFHTTTRTIDFPKGEHDEDETGFVLDKEIIEQAREKGVLVEAPMKAIGDGDNPGSKAGAAGSAGAAKG